MPEYSRGGFSAEFEELQTPDGTKRWRPVSVKHTVRRVQNPHRERRNPRPLAMVYNPQDHYCELTGDQEELPGDHHLLNIQYGHIAALSLGGPDILANSFPLYAHVNRGTQCEQKADGVFECGYAGMEENLRQLIRSQPDQSVCLQVDIEYPQSLWIIPSVITVTAMWGSGQHRRVYKVENARATPVRIPAEDMQGAEQQAALIIRANIGAAEAAINDGWMVENYVADDNTNPFANANLPAVENRPYAFLDWMVCQGHFGRLHVLPPDGPGNGQKFLLEYQQLVLIANRLRPSPLPLDGDECGWLISDAAEDLQGPALLYRAPDSDQEHVWNEYDGHLLTVPGHTGAEVDHIKKRSRNSGSALMSNARVISARLNQMD